MLKKPICKTDHGKKTVGKGYNAELYVKRKLWNYNYHVSQVLYEYDLLVDDTVRVEVKTGKMRLSPNGEPYWLIFLPTNLHKNYDVLAVVLPLIGKESKILFYKKDIIDNYIKENYEKRPIAITFRTSKKELFDRALKNPFQAFGKPKYFSTGG